MGMTMAVHRDGATVRQLRAMRRRASKPEPTLWRSIGAYLAGVNTRQFVTEGAYSGHKWRPLTPDYAKWKVTHGYGRKILVRTGALRASYTSRPMSVERYASSVSGGSFSVAWKYGSNVSYAKYHHYGTRYMPARPTIVVTSKMTGDLRAIVEDYIATGRTSGARRV